MSQYKANATQARSDHLDLKTEISNLVKNIWTIHHSMLNYGL
jgi:hypothetical protein